MTRRPEEPRPLLSGGAETSDDLAAASLLMRLPTLREDQVGRERIWRALSQAQQRPRQVWRPLAVGAGVAVVALAVAFGTVAKRPAPARLELAAGSVLLAAPEADWIGGQAGAALPAGSRVRTDGVSRAVISLQRAALIAEASTDIGLEALGGETLLRLSGGTLVAEVDPLRAHESFVVLTTHYRVTVKGTIFLVRERTPDDVEVSVSRGRVEVSGAGGAWQVAAGQSWSSRRPAGYGADSIAEEQRQLLDEAVHPGHRKPLVVSDEDKIVSAEDLPSGDSALAPPPSPLSAPPTAPIVSKASPVVRPRAPMVLARLDPSIKLRAAKAASTTPNSAAAAASDLPETGPAPVPTPAPPPLEQALDLVRSHRFPEAERALEALSTESGSGADIALYELADLRQRHLGDFTGALAALQSYRTTYPQGALLQEAEISMIELELARPDPSAALSQINQFLSTYPNSERASEVQWLRGNLLRARGDCAGALESYRRVQGSSSREEEALYFRAVCQEQLGQTSAATETLRTYLQRFPSANHAAAAQRALAGR